jgi:hypothetical protein
MFEPFFMTKPMRHRTGLGSAVVHGTVETHGGTIHIVSGLGRGARFDIYLPRIDEASERAAPDSHDPECSRGDEQRVVYIEDVEVVALKVQGLLTRLGYRATMICQHWMRLRRSDSSQGRSTWWSSNPTCPPVPVSR